MGDEREVPEVEPQRVKRPSLQREFVVGSALDPLEAHADEVAAEAMRRIREGGDQGPVVGSVERARTAGRVQARFESEAIGAEGGAVGPATSALIGRARRSGRPLDAPLRRSMESGFGADFSGVRVHHDAVADQASTTLQAEAFTTGSDVFFRSGAYRPETQSGQELIAHELAHTVQQGASRAVRRHVHNGATEQHLRPLEKRIPRAGTIHRSLSAVDPKLGDKKWRLLVSMVDSYNKSPMDNVRYRQLDAIAQAAQTYASPGLFGRIGAGNRISAAKSLLSQVSRERAALGGALQDQTLKEASTARANEAFLEAQAEKRIKERRDAPKPGRLDLAKFGATIPGADFGAVADVFTQGRDEQKYSEELVEFQGRTGEAETNLGFMKKKGEVVITVNVPFTGESGHDATIQSGLDQYWNVFQAEYKGPITAGSREVKGAKGQTHKVKVLEAPPPSTGVVDFTFKIGKSSGSATKSGKSPVQDSHDKAGALGASTAVEDRFGVKVVSPVFLFTGNHPNWQSRMHLGADGAKTRSDAGNWRMDDAGVERMVAHEFGHLIGLSDEYSQTHTDMVKNMGKKSSKYAYDGADKPALKGADQVDYGRIKQAFKDSLSKPEAVATLAKELKEVYDDDPERFAFLSAHFYENDAEGLSVGRRHFAKALEVLAKWHEPKTTKAADEAAKRQSKSTAKAGSVKERAHLMDAQRGETTDKAAIKLGAEMKSLADQNSYDVNWMWYSSAGFRSGGLMGDYTTIDSGAEDTRYNAIAHDHKHPLEPRHMKRFVDLLSASRGEKWEVKYK